MDFQIKQVPGSTQALLFSVGGSGGRSSSIGHIFKLRLAHAVSLGARQLFNSLWGLLGQLLRLQWGTLYDAKCSSPTELSLAMAEQSCIANLLVLVIVLS